MAARLVTDSAENAFIANWSLLAAAADDLHVGQVLLPKEQLDKGVVGASVGLPAEQRRDRNEAGQDPDGDDHDEYLGRSSLKESECKNS